MHNLYSYRLVDRCFCEHDSLLAIVESIQSILLDHYIGWKQFVDGVYLK